MLRRVSEYFWGGLSQEEIKKFGLLGTVFFCIIGFYWLLRTQKDAVFATIVGFSHQPKAKMLSWIVTFLVLIIYSKLVDLVERRRLLMGLSFFYGISFLAIAFLLKHPTIGLSNAASDTHRALGWVVYPFIESFGTVMTSLFWSFVTSSTTEESAKRGYSFIIAGGQSGAILGTILSWNSVYFGNEFLFILGAFGIMALIPIMFLYSKFVPSHLRKNVHQGEKAPKTGIFEGLKILLQQPYVLGILGLTMCYEVVLTISEYEMKLLATEIYQTTATFASFNGMYGFCTNILSLLFAVVGTSFLMRRFGVAFCLYMFPIVTGLMILGVYAMPMLTMVTIAVIVMKGLSYALNNPTREILYMPTTRDVRFKAKSWIDQFGARSSKAIGATINNAFGGNIANLFVVGSFLSFGFVGLWLMTALFVGRTFNQLIKDKKVVG